MRPSAVRSCTFVVACAGAWSTALPAIRRPTGTTDIFSEGLLREFAWCAALLKAQPWRSVRLTVSRQSVSILSDAAWEPGQDGVGVASLCWLVFGRLRPGAVFLLFLPSSWSVVLSARRKSQLLNCSRPCCQSCSRHGILRTAPSRPTSTQ